MFGPIKIGPELNASAEIKPKSLGVGAHVGAVSLQWSVYSLPRQLQSTCRDYVIPLKKFVYLKNPKSGYCYCDKQDLHSQCNVCLIPTSYTDIRLYLPAAHSLILHIWVIVRAFQVF